MYTEKHVLIQNLTNGFNIDLLLQAGVERTVNGEETLTLRVRKNSDRGRGLRSC